jgi:hypothetical protein
MKKIFTKTKKRIMEIMRKRRMREKKMECMGIME